METYNRLWKLIHTLPLTIDYLSDAEVSSIKSFYTHDVPVLLKCSTCKVHYEHMMDKCEFHITHSNVLQTSAPVAPEPHPICDNCPIPDVNSNVYIHHNEITKIQFNDPNMFTSSNVIEQTNPEYVFMYPDGIPMSNLPVECANDCGSLLIDCLDDIHDIISPFKFFMWTVRLHNNVNRLIKKPVFDTTTTLETYFTQMPSINGETFMQYKTTLSNVLDEFTNTPCGDVLHQDERDRVVSSLMQIYESKTIVNDALKVLIQRPNVGQPVPFANLNYEHIHLFNAMFEFGDLSSLSDFETHLIEIVKKTHLKTRLCFNVVLFYENVLEASIDTSEFTFIEVDGKKYIYNNLNGLFNFSVFNKDRWNEHDDVNLVLKITIPDLDLTEYQSHVENVGAMLASLMHQMCYETTFRQLITHV